MCHPKFHGSVMYSRLKTGVDFSDFCLKREETLLVRPEIWKQKSHIWDSVNGKSLMKSVVQPHQKVARCSSLRPLTPSLPTPSLPTLLVLR